MFGVIVNVITVMLGSCIGLLFKKGIPEKVSTAVMIGLGACMLYIGISGNLCGKIYSQLEIFFSDRLG